MKYTFLILATLVFITGCLKDKTDPSLPLRNPADYTAFRDGNYACVVNNGQDRVWLIELRATTQITLNGPKRFWYKDFTLSPTDTYIEIADTFKYDLRLLPPDGSGNPPAITHNDTTLREFKYFIFDHYYVDEVRNNPNAMSGIYATWKDE